MSQATNWQIPIIGPMTPSTFAGRLRDNFNALLSEHSGSTEPSYKVVGTTWADTSVAGVITRKYWDGSAWRTLMTINTATGVISYAGPQTTDVTVAAPFVDFTLSPGFRSYRLTFSEVQGAVNNAQLALRVSENDGASYRSTSGDYLKQMNYNTTASGIATISASTETMPLITAPIDNSNALNGASGCLTIHPGSASKRFSVNLQSEAIINATNYLTIFNGSVKCLTNAARVNKIRLLMSSGNIATGKFTLESVP
ncbi:hypothetical protein FHR70_003745 [Microvirga lupini]|uniref:Uncharacterized protein n=1 Tax=Microvirga lupini TaxID=420324 RepID=A0A7W4YYT8_9HYPH|nr:hypothetical protein [Microvirga lupini]MBB3020659.1 hypothetical protein [Microvirga lupini]